MTTATLTLPQWLEQCIAADEAEAQAAWGERWTALTMYPDRSVVLTTPTNAPASMVTTEHKDDSTATHIATHDPARVLRQCAALREVIALHAAWESESGGQYGPDYWQAPMDAVLHALAQVFRDRPGWQETWA